MKSDYGCSNAEVAACNTACHSNSEWTKKQSQERGALSEARKFPFCVGVPRVVKLAFLGNADKL